MIRRILAHLIPPRIPPGLYRLHGPRVYDHTELKVVRYAGRWCVVRKAPRRTSPPRATYEAALKAAEGVEG